MKRVLVADALQAVGVDALRKHGLDVDVAGSLDERALIARIGEYEGLVVRSATRVTRAGAEALGLGLFCKATPSPALTAVTTPPGLNSEQIVTAYSKTHNITIAGGQGEMKGRIFRLGHMGYAAELDVIVALAALEQVLAELGQPVDFGAGVRGAQKVFAEKS